MSCCIFPICHFGISEWTDIKKKKQETTTTTTKTNNTHIYYTVAKKQTAWFANIKLYCIPQFNTLYKTLKTLYTKTSMTRHFFLPETFELKQNSSLFCNTASNLWCEIARTGSTAKSRGEPHNLRCYCAVSAVPDADYEEDLIKLISKSNNEKPAQDLSTI